MKIKHLPLTLAALLGLHYLASAQSVSYQVTKDDPDINNITVSANVLDFNAYIANMSFGYNVYGNVFLGKILQGDVDYRRSFDDAGKGVFAPADIGKGYQIRIGGRFNLINRLGSGKARVVLSSFTSGRYTHSTYIKVPASFRRIFSVRGGIQTYHDICDLSSIPDKDDNVMYYKDANGNKQQAIDKSSFESMYYTVDAVGFYAGISYKSIVNVMINAEGYGKRSRCIANDFYLDALLTPSVTYTLKPNDKQMAAFKDADINISENKRNYFGWRFGWQAFMGRHVAFTSKFEVGQQPGNYNGNWYVSCGIGLGFGARVPGLTGLFSKSK